MNTLANVLDNPTRPTATKKPKVKSPGVYIVSTAAVVKDSEPNVSVKETAQQKSARLAAARIVKAAAAARADKENRVLLSKPYNKGKEITIGDRTTRPRVFEVLIRKDLNKPAEGKNLVSYRVTEGMKPNEFTYITTLGNVEEGTITTRHGVSFSRVRAALKKVVGGKR